MKIGKIKCKLQNQHQLLLPRLILIKFELSSSNHAGILHIIFLLRFWVTAVQYCLKSIGQCRLMAQLLKNNQSANISKNLIPSS
jgi:hypothetical protein